MAVPALLSQPSLHASPQGTAMKTSFLLVLFVFWSIPGLASAEQLRETRVSDGRITASVRYAPVYRSGGDFDLAIGLISSDGTSVCCMSIYRDFSYELRDEAGHVVATRNLAHMRDPVQEGTIPAMGSITDYMYWVLLTNVYADLRPGRYQLVIRISPRNDIFHSITLPPVRFAISATSGCRECFSPPA
jgi:hypothetical protein